MCGSTFLDNLNAEIMSKGNYTQTGWNRQKSIDFGIADLELKDISFIYDPTLDDLSKEKYCYIFDDRHLHPMVMEGEDDRTHSPSRPEDKYVLFRSMTWTGGLVQWQRNSAGVYTTA
jgi:hypothetical protein